MNNKTILVIIFAVFILGSIYLISSQGSNLISNQADQGLAMEETLTFNGDAKGMEETAIPENSYIDISPQEAKQMIDGNPNLIVIDVSPNYDQGHLPGSINYYVGDGSLDEAIPTLDRDADYLIYCHSDSASMLGAQKLIDSEFTNVYRLEGNYAAWVDAGYEIEK